MDEPAYKVIGTKIVHNDNLQFAGYGTSAPAESPEYATYKQFEITVDPQEGKKILNFIEQKACEALENFDIPEYVVLSRTAFIHLMGYLSTEYGKLKSMEKAPIIQTSAGPLTLIPVVAMNTIEVIGDIDRKVFREE